MPGHLPGLAACAVVPGRGGGPTTRLRRCEAAAGHLTREDRPWPRPHVCSGAGSRRWASHGDARARPQRQDAHDTPHHPQQEPTTQCTPPAGLTCSRCPHRSEGPYPPSPRPTVQGHRRSDSGKQRSRYWLLPCLLRLERCSSDQLFPSRLGSAFDTLPGPRWVESPSYAARGRRLQAHLLRHQPL